MCFSSVFTFFIFVENQQKSYSLKKHSGFNLLIIQNKLFKSCLSHTELCLLLNVPGSY